MFRRNLVVHVLHRVDDGVMSFPPLLLHVPDVFRGIFLPLSTELVGGLLGFILNLLIISYNLKWIAVLLLKQVNLVLELADDVLDFFFDLVQRLLHCIVEL